MTVSTVAQRMAQRQSELEAERREHALRNGIALPTQPTPLSKRERVQLADGRKAPKLIKGGARKAAPISLAGPPWSHP